MASGWRWVAIRSAVALVSMAGCWLAYTEMHGRSRLLTVGFLGAVSAGAILARTDPDRARWLRGADGEVATARALGRLSKKRWYVFHDLAVPGSRANIDHLAVGRTGVWVIDTKTTRAPVRIGFRSVRLGDRRLSPESVLWQSEVVSDRLGVPVRPLISLVCARRLEPSRFPRRGVKRDGVRIVLAADITWRLRHGGQRLTRPEADGVAREVLAVFRPAGPVDRQNEAGRPKRRP